MLDLASNELCTLPSDLSFLTQLTDLNLSANNFSSDSVLVSPDHLFSSLATIPNLVVLNLSRNKLHAFHNGNLPPDNLSLEPAHQVFTQLRELNMSFNQVNDQQHLFYCPAQFSSLMKLVITGNPFAITGNEEYFMSLKYLMEKGGGELVNETLNAQMAKRNQRAAIPVGKQKPPLMLMNGQRDQKQEQELFSGMDKRPAAAAQPVPPAAEEEEQPFFLTENARQGVPLNDQKPSGPEGEE